MRNSLRIVSSIGDDSLSLIGSSLFSHFKIIDLDRKNIKLTSSSTPTEVVKILKMTLAPSGDRTEQVKVRYLV